MINLERQKIVSPADNWCDLKVFSTKKMFETMHRSQYLYIDDTFRTAPQPFTQLVTVHGFYYGSLIPLAFFLLVDNTVGL